MLRSFSLNTTFGIRRGRTIPVGWCLWFIRLTTTKIGFLQSPFVSMVRYPKANCQANRGECKTCAAKLLNGRLWFSTNRRSTLLRSVFRRTFSAMFGSVSDSTVVNDCRVRCYPPVPDLTMRSENRDICRPVCCSLTGQNG